MISQDLSEFALHARAILTAHSQFASVWASSFCRDSRQGQSTSLSFSGLDKALATPDTQVRLFGKPEVAGERRVGVALASVESIDDARSKALAAASAVDVVLG